MFNLAIKKKKRFEVVDDRNITIHILADRLYDLQFKPIDTNALSKEQKQWTIDCIWAARVVAMFEVLKEHQEA